MSYTPLPLYEQRFSNLHVVTLKTMRILRQYEWHQAEWTFHTQSVKECQRMGGAQMFFCPNCALPDETKMFAKSLRTETQESAEIIYCDLSAPEAERTISLRFLGIILRVLGLEVSVNNFHNYKPVSNHFCSRGGGIKIRSRGDCDWQGGKSSSQLRPRIRPLESQWRDTVLCVLSDWFEKATKLRCGWKLEIKFEQCCAPSFQPFISFFLNSYIWNSCFPMIQRWQG